MGRLRTHLAGNVVGYIALFVALGGSAWALGANTVGSTQLKNGGVKGVDVAESTLGKVPNAARLSGKPAGKFARAPASATFSSHDPNDFVIPTASEGFTQVIITGDNANGSSGGALVRLRAPGRVLATASATLSTTAAQAVNATCRFGIAPKGDPSPSPFGVEATQSIVAFGTTTLSMSAGVSKPAGNYYVNVGCRGGTNADPVSFLRGDLIAWTLPA